MLIREAKAVARRWAAGEGAALPGFAGAFIHGSAAWLAEHAELPAGSDVDIMIVVDGPAPPAKLGKFLYGGVLLEVSYIEAGELRSPEQVLGSSHLAGSLRAPVLADPTGRLAPLQAAVAAGFAQPRWVRARCEHVRQKILGNLRSLGEPAPLHEHVGAWLFAAGLTTHALLVAGLRNPTVRRRYVAARELLAGRGRLDIYEELLGLLGCAGMRREAVDGHLAALAEMFDAAAGEASGTPFFFKSDISQEARPIAIDGSRALVEAGLHREAVFWIVATASRCQAILHHGAPEALRERFLPPYLALLADLGIASQADLPARGEQVRAYLPRLMEAAEVIMGANATC